VPSLDHQPGFEAQRACGRDLSACLSELATRFCAYARANRNLWNLVIVYRYKPGHARSKTYDAIVAQLIGLIVDAVGGVFEPGEEARALAARGFCGSACSGPLRWMPATGRAMA